MVASNDIKNHLINLETQLGHFRLQLLRGEKQRNYVIWMKECTKMLDNEVSGDGVNLFFQGLHGCVLHLIPLLSDPVGFIGNQGCHNKLD